MSSWKATWGTIDWEHDTEEKIIRKIDKFRKRVWFNERDKSRRTALHYAVAHSTPAIVELLLENEASPNARDVIGWTPLHWAADSGRAEVVKLLLEYQAHANVRDDEGETPLFRAACWGNAETVKLLVENGARIDIKDKYGRMLLHRAAWRGRAKTVKYLLEHLPENFINKQDELGQTALHNAVSGDRPTTARMLIELGADVNIKDKYNKTALDLAKNPEVIKVIKDAEKIRRIYRITHFKTGAMHWLASRIAGRQRG